MIEKLAQAGEGGRCKPIPFHYIYHHVQSCGVRSMQLRGQIHYPYFYSIPICTLCARKISIPTEQKVVKQHTGLISMKGHTRHPSFSPKSLNHCKYLYCSRKSILNMKIYTDCSQVFKLLLFENCVKINCFCPFAFTFCKHVNATKKVQKCILKNVILELISFY
jgi:hypothetical protein